MAGGKKLPEIEALTMAYRAIQEGAAGVDMGRNVFQSEAPAGGDDTELHEQAQLIEESQCSVRWWLPCPRRVPVGRCTANRSRRIDPGTGS
jgi:hypothetical protein